tara:strand:- start:126 stop:932 length:807 start_codon:yes stop_codon:yes gene_type:complete
MKVCRRCKESKELEEFSKQKLGKGGLTSKCKECINSVAKARNATPEGKAYNKEANKAYRAKPENKVKAEEASKAYRAKPEVRAKYNAAQKARKATPEAKAKKSATDKARNATLEGKAKNKAKAKAWARIPENRAKQKVSVEAWHKAEKQERIEYLMKNFDKLESEISGTIYHFKIKGAYKIGKTINGFDTRYSKQVQKDATQITEWVMNEKQMDAFEKIILDKTKEFQHIGDDVLPCTGNREIRTNDNEQLIDTLLAELNVNHIKLKR